MEQRTLPMLKERGVRFVELARRGHLEEDGIVVLQDTCAPEKLHPDGVYKLSDELLMSGTVPQFGGEHRCAMKFKAFVIETWLAHEFHGCIDYPVKHVFGYNAKEISRIVKSDEAIALHNAERQILTPGRTPLEVFGFNSEEVSRIERSRKYDGPTRIGLYPLQEWAWNRQKCLDYILEKSGLLWKKSHCSFCPFCAEAAKGEEQAVARWFAAPEQTAKGLLVEFNSMCFNPRGFLYKKEPMIAVVKRRQVRPVLEAFEGLLEYKEWAIYKVRRIYTAKGKAMRYVERQTTGHRNAMLSQLRDLPSTLRRTYPEVATDTAHNIDYVMFARRKPDTYPAVEGFYVAAPNYMADKLRGKPEVFEERWRRAIAGLPLKDEPEDTVNKGGIGAEEETPFDTPAALLTA